VVSFADRGRDAKRFRGPGGRAGSRVQVYFYYFRPRPNLPPLGRSQVVSSGLFFVPPPHVPGPGPWRTLEVRVSPSAIEVFWTNDRGETERVALLPRGRLDVSASLLKRVEPELAGYAFNPSERGAVGLYVRNSAASFRNVVLAPFDAGR
jgi:hypothetical protein